MGTNFVGRPVYQYWSRSLRFGIITEEKLKKRWKYCKIDWIDDSVYEESINYMLSIYKGKREYDAEYDWYRIDKINLFEPNKIIKKIEMLLSEIDKKEKIKNSG